MNFDPALIDDLARIFAEAALRELEKEKPPELTRQTGGDHLYHRENENGDDKNTPDRRRSPM